MAVSALISTVSLGCIAVDLDTQQLQNEQAAVLRSQMVMVLLDGLALNRNGAALDH